MSLRGKVTSYVKEFFKRLKYEKIENNGKNLLCLVKKYEDSESIFPKCSQRKILCEEEVRSRL